MLFNGSKAYDNDVMHRDHALNALQLSKQHHDELLKGQLRCVDSTSHYYLFAH